MKVAIYARVSTKDQHCEMQLTDLRKYAKHRSWEIEEHVEKASSVKRRPVFDAMLQKARKGDYDVVLVWRIDRFARSMQHFVQTTLQLKQWGVRLISVTENVDSGDENPFARFMLGLLGLLAELEHGIIVERVQAGVIEAKRQGKHCGRPRKVFRRDQAAAMRAGGMSWGEIARILLVPKSSIRRACEGVPKVSAR